MVSLCSIAEMNTVFIPRGFRDSILECQERKSLASSLARYQGGLDAISEVSDLETRIPGSFAADDFPATTERLSVFARTTISDVHNSPIPRSPRSPNAPASAPQTPHADLRDPHTSPTLSSSKAQTPPTSPISPLSRVTRITSGVNKPASDPHTPDASRPQSPSIRNLGQRSVVKQRLAKIEADISALESPVSSARSSICQLPTPVRSILNPRHDKSSPAGVLPPLNLKESPSPSPVCIVRSPATNSAPPPSSVELVESPLSLFSGRLTSIASSTPVVTRTARWVETNLSAETPKRVSVVPTDSLSSIESGSPLGKATSTAITRLCNDSSVERPRLTIITETEEDSKVVLPNNILPGDSTQSIQKLPQGVRERYPKRTYADAVHAVKAPFSREYEWGKEEAPGQRSYSEAITGTPKGTPRKSEIKVGMNEHQSNGCVSELLPSLPSKSQQVIPSRDHSDISNLKTMYSNTLDPATEYQELEDSRVYTKLTVEKALSQKAQEDSIPGGFHAEQPSVTAIQHSQPQLSQDAPKGIAHKIFETIGLSGGRPEASDVDMFSASTRLTTESTLRSGGSSIGANTAVSAADISGVLDKLDELHSEFKGMKSDLPALSKQLEDLRLRHIAEAISPIMQKNAKSPGASAEMLSQEWSRLHTKLDDLTVSCQILQSRSNPDSKQEVSGMIDTLRGLVLTSAA